MMKSIKLNQIDSVREMLELQSKIYSATGMDFAQWIKEEFGFEEYEKREFHNWILNNNKVRMKDSWTLDMDNDKENNLLVEYVIEEMMGEIYFKMNTLKRKINDAKIIGDMNAILPLMNELENLNF